MSIEVFNEDPSLPVNEAMLIDVASFALAKMDVHPAAELAIMIVDEPTIEGMHEQWLGLPGPTDVMSFPMDGYSAVTSRPDTPDAMPMSLGDIVLCPVFAEKQAKRAGHDLAHELALLTVHGVLHVLGYDHVKPEEEQTMFGLQNTILRAWYDHLAETGETYHPRPDNEQAFPTAADRLDLDRQMAEDGRIPAVALSPEDTNNQQQPADPTEGAEDQPTTDPNNDHPGRK
ncbi:rRNA maturation RNase YbeY [Corynebacterium choanae]|uniref:Endoribonuclease YbeY n=1 Tax=Corynebacterium choanae TaxID=1862358 RepID=A0A3G6J8C5_9CORY|nr:rRNA maturation RNase YbeY [Corynebacterium choanae]AZA14062.1 Endoribonuclease YbeY [Corynebacterium choanae]